METIPFFSICVPTRNRSETLYHCLRTLLHQDFESYEIIVSDNSDEQESLLTRGIVNDFDSIKIKYFKQPVVLSMTENYEFALSKARGEFVICLGDDDGLVINSLQYVRSFIEKYNAKVVKCCEICYFWIGSTLFPESILTYPLERPVIQVMSKSVLEKVASFELGYFTLPMIYYAFISREIIQKVVLEKGSFFQNSASIDMYSGFIIAYNTESFYITDKPFSICGQSNKSNGATVISTYENKISQEYLAQHNLIAIYNKYEIPFLNRFSMPIFVSLELSKFIDNHNVDKNDLKIDYKNIFIDSLADESFIENGSTTELIEHFRSFSRYNNDIQHVSKYFFDKKSFYPKLGNHDTTINKYINIDPITFGIKDVYDASVFCKDIINSKLLQRPVSISVINNQKDKKTPSVLEKISTRLKLTWRIFKKGHL